MSAQTYNPGDFPDQRLVAVCGTAIDRSPLPMAIVDGPDHILRCINPALCLLLGRTTEQLLGRPISVLIPNADAFHSSLERVYRSGDTYVEPVSSRREGSQTFSAHAMWPILDSFQSPIGVMIQANRRGVGSERLTGNNRAFLINSQREQEVTKKLNEQLRIEEGEHGKALEALVKSEKLASLGRIAASVAHEINNPLEAVTNIIYLARTVQQLPEDARRYLDMADKELDRIAQITRQTLGFYRESTTATTFSVASLLEAVFSLLASKIQHRRAAVKCQVDRNLHVTAHFGELRQVLSNLVLNSLDAIGEGGKIRLRATPQICTKDHSRHVRISIADDGGGIDADALPRLFEPFFTTKGSAGNGLGLWVSREIIHKHGGKIHVRSATYGAHMGTTFSVILPEAAAASPES